MWFGLLSCPMIVSIQERRAENHGTRLTSYQNMTIALFLCKHFHLIIAPFGWEWFFPSENGYYKGFGKPSGTIVVNYYNDNSFIIFFVMTNTILKVLNLICYNQPIMQPTAKRELLLVRCHFVFVTMFWY